MTPELPYPWHLTDPSLRRDAAEALPASAETRAAAVAALEACVGYFTDPSEPGGPLPDDFGDYFFRLSRDFRKRMPTLADVSREIVRQWVDGVFGPQPDEVVEAVERFWVSASVEGAAEDLVRWLRASRSDDALPVLRAAVPRLPWRVATATVPAVADLGGAGERAFLQGIADDPGVAGPVREEAARELRHLDAAR